MTIFRSNGDRVPDHILAMAEEAKAGKVDRREFLAMASVFGASTAMAYGLLGLADPTPAKAEEVQGKKGGILKVAQWIKDPKDPRKAEHAVGHRGGRTENAGERQELAAVHLACLGFFGHGQDVIRNAVTVRFVDCHD